MPKPTTLVLLPGLDGTDVFFRPLLASLPEWVRPHVISFPLIGANEYAHLLAIVREAVSEIPSFYVLGSSFAGPLALMLAEAEPTRVRGVILSATFVSPPRPIYVRLRFAAVAPAIWMLRACRRIPVWLSRGPTDQLRLDKAETWRRVSARMVAARIRALLDVDARDLLRDCPHPVLCLAGRDDGIVPRRNVEEIKRVRPSTQVRIIEGRHFAPYTNPTAAAEAIAEFMKNGTEAGVNMKQQGDRRHLSGILPLVLAAVFLVTGHAPAQRHEMPTGYPQSLEGDLRALLSAVREGPPTPGLLVRLAETYFDLADDFLKDKAQRLAAYEAGAQAAKQAYELDESNADAHFFHAVHIGSAERLKGIANAAMVVKEMKHCALRAIELNPRHAQALQMLGGMLIELPWFLGGDDKKAQDYLERAIAADGNYTKARLLLAKLYRKQGRIDEVRRQLEAVIHADRPHYAYTWAREYKPQAEQILREIAGANDR